MLRRPTPTIRAITTAAVVGVLAWWTLATVARNRVWQSDLALWTDTSAKSPTAGLPFRSLAISLQLAGRVDEAVATYDLALQKRNDDSGRITIYNNMGSIALTRGDLATAEREYRRALAISPMPDCLFNLGVISLTRARQADEQADPDSRQREAERALPLLQRAEGLSPHDPDIQAAIGQALAFLGKETEAHQRYERALALGLTGPTAAQIRAVLAKPAR